MKILYHFRTRGVGAEAVHIAGIANAFEERGHSVEFCSPSGVDPRETRGSNPFKSNASSSGSRKKTNKLVELIGDFGFECMELAYNFYSFLKVGLRIRCKAFGLIYERHAFFLCATGILASLYKVPLVVEVNELVGDERIRKQPWLSSLARLCDRICFKRARLIVVVSPHLKKRIEAMGIDPEKVMVLPNAVDEAFLERVCDGSGRQIRKKHQVTDSIVIGFIGWFVSWHQLDRLLSIVADLCKEFPQENIRLMLVGDGPLKEELKDFSRSLGIEENLIFTGAADYADVPSYIGAFDIAVVPSSNAFRSPIKLFEYMAGAKPVLSPDTEPIRMVVKNGENGVLFESENKASMLSCCKDLLRDADKRALIGERARESVQKNHTWGMNVERILAVL